MNRTPIITMLEERGAGSIDHPGGTLLAHLHRVADLLEAWDAGDELVAAGLAHAVYGTDGFDVALFRLEERSVVAAVTGAPVEGIVYRYACCDRSYVLGQIGTRQPVTLRDRFTGATVALDATEVHELAELTVANELDVARHNDAFRRQHGEALATLFSGWHAVVTEAAYDSFLDILGTFAAPAPEL